MARLDGMMLCELAFLDRQDRLCAIGIVRQLTVPSVPIALHHIMLVAQLADLQPVEELAIWVGVMTPAGRTSKPTSSDSFAIDVVHDHVFITLRGLPLAE